MALHGSTVPTDHGEFVVTVVCPNAYSHQRLMQAINSIVPDAGSPDDAHGNTAAPPSLAEVAAAGIRRGLEQEDDTGEPYPIKAGGTQ